MAPLPLLKISPPKILTILHLSFCNYPGEIIACWARNWRKKKKQIMIKTDKVLENTESTTQDADTVAEQ